MKSSSSSPQLQGFQKTIFSTFLIGLFIALSITWLKSISHDVTDLFWKSVIDTDVPASWTALELFACLLILWKPLGIGRWRLPDLRTCSIWLDRRIALFALATFPFYAALGYAIFHGHALSMDEYTVLFQSQILASGHISSQVSPSLIDWMIPGRYQGWFFQVSHTTGNITSAYWPGYALLLTPFSFLGVPFLCNPFLSALTVWATHRATLKMTASLETAFWATLFTFTAPVIAVSAGTYYSMPAHLLCNILFCWLLSLETRRAAFGAGLVGSLALLLHNPVPHATFALPWIVFLTLRRRSLLWPLLAGYLLVGVPLGLWWMSQWNGFDKAPAIATNQATSGHQSSTDTLTRILHFFEPPSGGLWLARIAGMFKVVLWAAPGMAVLAWYGARATLKETYPRLLCASVLITFAAYLFVPFLQGWGWGYRYMHSAWMAFPILAGIYLTRLPTDANFQGISLRRFFGACAALCALILVPQRALQARQCIDDLRNMIPSAPTTGASITFVINKLGDSRTSQTRNDPFLRNNHWMFTDKGNTADEQMAYKFLTNPKKLDQGEWGQIWVGDTIIRE